MIYHFCNDDFGAPFRAELARFSSGRGIPLITIFSAKRRRAGPRRAIELAAGFMRGLTSGGARAARGSRTRFIDDVNADEFVRSIAPHSTGVISGFNQIFKERTIRAFDRFVNVHPSVLPMYAGPTPIEACLDNHETKTGYTIHEVTPVIDGGPILFQESVDIAGEGVTELSRRIGELAARELRRYLEHELFGAPWTPVTLNPSDVYRFQ